MFDLIRRPSSSLTNAFSDEFDRLFNEMMAPIQAVSRQLSMPSADVFYEDGNMVIELNVPGFSENDIEITTDNNAIEIRGQRQEKEETKAKKRSYLLRENSVNFYRRVALPEGTDSEKVTASLEDGVLKVSVPVEEKQQRRIAIAASKSGSKARINTEHRNDEA